MKHLNFLRIVIIILFSITASSYASSIVFVHLGNKLPEHIYDALLQARLFNKTCPIYLIADQKALDDFHDNKGCNVSLIPLETIKKTSAHEAFILQSKLDRKSRDGFWFYASERFFYLDDFMQQYNEYDVFHLENDVMLYLDLEAALPLFSKHYHGIAATFDNDERCIPSLMYFANPHVMHMLAECFLQNALTGKNDMEVIAHFKKAHESSIIDQLPIIMGSYHYKYPLKSTMGQTTQHPEFFSNHFDAFNAVFDAAALGQYLGGIDPRNGKSEAGFINERCLFNPGHCTFKMKYDHEGRLVPYIIFDAQEYRINNLHIHSKNLKPFLSKKRLPPTSAKKNIECAVISSYSGGRFGDNLLAFAEALYFSMKLNYPLILEPFPYADHLALYKELQLNTPQNQKKFNRKVIFQGGNLSLPHPQESTLYVVPYFPDAHAVEYTSQKWPTFFIDWNDPIFTERLKKLVTPLKPINLITPPPNKLSIAVHIRKGKAFDNWSDQDRLINEFIAYKSPLDEYFINQIQRVAELFKGMPLYVYIFTDDPNPAELVATYKSALNNPIIEFACNNDNANTMLDDFFSMTLFDVLIRPESNFSIMAQKIGNHALVIFPGKFLPKSRVHEGYLLFNESLDAIRSKVNLWM